MSLLKQTTSCGVYRCAVINGKGRNATTAGSVATVQSSMAEHSPRKNNENVGECGGKEISKNWKYFFCGIEFPQIF